MSDARWARLKHAFQGALDRPPDAREAWLAGVCADDTDLLREVRALLAAHDEAPAFLETPAAFDPMDLDVWPAGTVAGQYRIVHELGRGGMGVVYLAEDTQLGRQVALKALPPAVAEDPERRARLTREARATAAISHPGVAAVYAYQQIDEHLVLVSEYVSGTTLREAIGRDGLPEDRATRIAIQIAIALGAAHEAGVVHRDLKPENVILTDTGGVKIVDFGIAHVDEPAATRLTRTGSLLGTPAYMAPEQLLGQPVDARADIYALGVILAEMVLGRHPLAPAPQWPHMSETPPPHLTRVWTRCMQTDPAARFGSMHEVLASLAEPAHPEVIPGGDLARWWWRFHQAAATVVYAVMAWPAWRMRERLGGAWGRLAFLIVLTAIIVAGGLRLHLWFTARIHAAGSLGWARRRAAPWLRAADSAFAGALILSGAALLDTAGGFAVFLLAVGIGSAVGFAVIEPATARAAFGAEQRPRRTPSRT